MCGSFFAGAVGRKRPAHGGPTGDKQQEPGRLTGLEDHIDLAAVFQDFPGAGEAGRNHEAVACAHGLGVAIGITQYGNALEDLAVFVLGVAHRPLADSAFPDAGAELAAGAAVVVAHALLGVALEHFLLGWTIVFGGGVGLGEVDDLLDVHLAYPW